MISLRLADDQSKQPAAVSVRRARCAESLRGPSTAKVSGLRRRGAAGRWLAGRNTHPRARKLRMSSWKAVRETKPSAPIPFAKNLSKAQRRTPFVAVARKG